MSDLIVRNINCFQTEKQLTILNNIRVLPIVALIDLRARNFVRVITSLRARCTHSCQRAHNLSSPVMDTFFYCPSLLSGISSQLNPHSENPILIQRNTGPIINSI